MKKVYKQLLYTPQLNKVNILRISVHLNAANRFLFVRNKTENQTDMSNETCYYLRDQHM